MRRWLALAIACGCAENARTGAASSSIDPAIQSALVVVASVEFLDPPGTYRAWEIRLGAEPPDTPCELADVPIATIDVFTSSSKAPYGAIGVITQLPPPVFPSALIAMPGAILIGPELTITRSALTGVAGQLVGDATVDGQVRDLAVLFEAPTCSF